MTDVAAEIDNGVVAVAVDVGVAAQKIMTGSTAESATLNDREANPLAEEILELVAVQFPAPAATL